MMPVDANEMVQSFAAAVVAQAVADYRSWRIKGVVSGLKLTEQGRALVATARGYSRKRCTLNRGEPCDLPGLLSFFAPGGLMEFWLQSAGLRVAPEAVRFRLMTEEVPRSAKSTKDRGNGL